MKSKLKLTLIILTIMILCLSVGAYAAYTLTATDVTYTKADGTTISVKQALDELHADKPLAKAVKIGDYVAYDAGTHSYESVTGTGVKSGNGYGSQTFTSNSSMKWRVIGWDNVTGGVVLISEEPINGLTMTGVIGYLYAEKELNEICKIYGYGDGADTSKKFKCLSGDVVEGLRSWEITGSGARSINIDDINKICNIIPGKEVTNWYLEAPYTKSIYYPDSTEYNGYSTVRRSRTDVSTKYSYTGSNFLSSEEEAYKVLFRNSTNTSFVTYWLASRCVESYSTSTMFSVRSVRDGYVTICTLGERKNN